jgi:microcompartment protein CcmL/EutN
MEVRSLGLVETRGYVAAIEAADAGAKAANVEVLGWENADGGLITIRFAGDVAAVRAAVTSASAAVQRVGKVYSVHVIARPSGQLGVISHGIKCNRKARPEPLDGHAGQTAGKNDVEQPLPLETPIVAVEPVKTVEDIPLVNEVEQVQASQPTVVPKPPVEAPTAVEKPVEAAAPVKKIVEAPLAVEKPVSEPTAVKTIAQEVAPKKAPMVEAKPKAAITPEPPRTIQGEKKLLAEQVKSAPPQPNHELASRPPGALKGRCKDKAQKGRGKPRF